MTFLPRPHCCAGVQTVAATCAVALALLAPAASPASGALPIALPGGLPLGPAPTDCSGPLDPASIPRLPGPPLRFGISPGATAGQVGPPQPAKAQDMGRTLAALGQLRPAHAPFVLRLTRLFSSDGESTITENLALAHRYTQAGFEVELQLRYRPPAGAGADLTGWLAFVREVVDRFGPDRGVVGLQVTNEVNFATSPDSSDGAYPGARDALIQGVEAAKRESSARGYGQLRVGFNWFYRADPASDQAFWAYLGQRGGAAFAAAVDWVGLDAYPGTFFPPSEPSGGYADGIVNALGVLRSCYMPSAGLGPSVAIQIEENGYPTGPGRSEEAQAQALREMVQAVSDYRAAFNVTDYRWFDLRDADSASTNFQQRFGLLRDDYSAKPAFAVYRQLVGALSAAAPAPALSGARRLRLRLTVRDRRGPVRGAACVRPPVTLRWRGPDATRLTRVSVALDGRRLAIGRGARAVRIPRAWLRGHRPHHLRFVASDRRLSLRVSLSLRRCGAGRGPDRV